MSSSYTRSPKAAKPASSGTQTVMAVLAAVLIVAAIIIVSSRSVQDKREEAAKVAASDPKVQLQQIQSNPDMPPQAKAIAQAQLRAHMAETSDRGAAHGAPGQMRR